MAGNYSEDELYLMTTVPQMIGSAMTFAGGSGIFGTGKEMFARAIHDAGPKRDEKFVAVNCGNRPVEALEAELFGSQTGKHSQPGSLRTAGAGHGERAERLWNTTSLRVPDVDGDLLLAALAAEGICVSGGAACSSGRRAPSGVLLALGLTPDQARATLRLSLSRLTRADEVELALERIPAVVKELRGLATHPAR